MLPYARIVCAARLGKDAMKLRLPTRRELPALALCAGSLGLALLTHNLTSWAWFTGAYFGTVIIGTHLIRWHGRRQVRKLLAEKPYLAYLLAIRREFGDDSKGDDS